MPQLLLELFSEEIPARMQAQASRDLERLMIGALTDRGYTTEGARAFATPRRLALVVEGLPAAQSDTREERKGPRVDAPAQAIDGFLRSTGLTREQLTVQKDQKGDFYLAVIERKGRPTPAVIAEIVPEIVKTFPWPKSQRWGAGDLTWVRPLHSILCTFDGELVKFEIERRQRVASGAQSSATIQLSHERALSIPEAMEQFDRTFSSNEFVLRSGTITYGHRFLNDGPIEARRFDDYVEKLKRAHVVLDPAERKQTILHDATQLAHAQNLELIADDGLADEVAGLVEWPVVLIGQFDKAFLDVPQEILISTMRANQKYFALKDPKTGKLANKFIVVANTITKDGGRAVVAGNERVLRARLSDAKFFWDQDLKTKLEDRVPQLASIVFHAKLGTQAERARRIQLIAGEIARLIGADQAKAMRAGYLCKADLVSGTVGEFPEVQGVMGRYFALRDEEGPEVADAIRDHYKPLGPNDQIPDSLVSISVALADKLDTLVGFFSMNEKPTGSRDPYALRRAALGLIRIIVERRLRLDLEDLILDSDLVYGWLDLLGGDEDGLPLNERLYRISEQKEAVLNRTPSGRREIKETAKLADRPFADDKNLLDFFYFLIDRIYVQFRVAGVRHDLLVAVADVGLDGDILLFVERVEALQTLLNSDDGKNLLAGYRRAANILRIEETKEKKRDAKHSGFKGAPVQKLLQLPQETALFHSIEAARPLILDGLKRSDFSAAMRAMAQMRAPVDAFFDKVTVNADDPKLRDNRLKLLNQIREAMHTVADFSKIEG